MAPDEAAFVATGGALYNLIAQYVATGAHNDTFQKLANQVREPGVEIELVIAYSSYRCFQDEQALQPAKRDTPPETLCPYALFGWKFFVPDDPNKSDLEHLKKAVALASHSELRETRQLFQGWLKRMHEGEVDIEEATRNMRELLNAYQKIVRKSKFNTAVRYAAKVVPVIAPLSHLFGFPLWQEAGTDVLSGAVPLFIEQLLPKTKMPPHLLPAAFVVAARRLRGKKYDA